MRRFILEVIIDASFFERAGRGNKKIFRYREETVLIPLRAKNLENAVRIARRKSQKISNIVFSPRIFAESTAKI